MLPHQQRDAGRAVEGQGGSERQFSKSSNRCDDAFQEGQIVNHFRADSALFQVRQHLGLDAITGIQQASQMIQGRRERGLVALFMRRASMRACRPQLQNASSRRLWFFIRCRMAPEQPVTQICAAK